MPKSHESGRILRALRACSHYLVHRKRSDFMLEQQGEA